MRSKYKSILVILILVMVLAGLSLLFLRQPFVDYLREANGVSAVNVPVRKSPPANTLINTDILEDERLINLKNNVTIFDFEDICGESVNTAKRCVVGNSNPF